MTNSIQVVTDSQSLLNLLSQHSIPSFVLVVDQDEHPIECRLADFEEITALMATIQERGPHGKGQ